jgi:L-ascorbate 6-phosphate lactonase
MPDRLPRSSSLTLTRLGQAGFLLEGATARLLIDPWVSEHELRLLEPPPAELLEPAVDWVLVTHEHLDHFDTPFLGELLSRPRRPGLVVPAPLEAEARAIAGSAPVVPVLPGDRVELGPVTVQATPAIHGVTVEDAYGDGSSLGGGPRFVGYVVELDGRRVYHAGDTLLTDDVRTAVERLAVDLALVPINGRDREREELGVVGNMSAGEAAELVLASGATHAVPYHWDGFEGNTVAPGAFFDALAGTAATAVLPALFRPLGLYRAPPA